MNNELIQFINGLLPYIKGFGIIYIIGYVIVGVLSIAFMVYIFYSIIKSDREFDREFNKQFKDRWKQVEIMKNCKKCGSNKKIVPLNPLNDNCKCAKCGAKDKIS